MDLSGQWYAEIQGEPEAFPVILPGTLDENGIGPRDTGENQWHPDQGDCGDLAGNERILTRLTRLHAYEGPAFFRRNVKAVPLPGERVFLEAERSRELSPFLGWKESGSIYGGDGIHPLRF